VNPFFALPQLGAALGAVAIYWALPRPWRVPYLGLASAAVLAWLDPAALVALGALTLLVSRTGSGLLWPLAGLAALFLGVRADPLLGLGLAVPLGFGFWVPRLAHVLVERQRDTLPAHELWDLWAYVAFLPTLRVGPIHRFDAFLRDHARQRWDVAVLARGAQRVLEGYAKLVVLAGWLVADLAHGQVLALSAAGRDGGVVLLECALYGGNLYFAFAGYSDIAIGFALMLGFRIRENFDHPFLRPNLQRFWESWHRSLSTWCRDYVFTPVLASTRRRAPALVLAMLVLAGWHELSLRYLCWGCWHAAGLVVHMVWRRRVAPRLGGPSGPLGRVAVRCLSTGLTVAFVLVGFVFTKNTGWAGIQADWGLLLGGAP